MTVRGTSQQSFAEKLVKKFRVTSVQSVPLKVGVKLEEFDEDEKTESWAFHDCRWFDVVGDFDTQRYLQRSSICCEVLFAPNAIHWKSALGMLAYILASDYRYFFRGFCRRRLRQ